MMTAKADADRSSLQAPISKTNSGAAVALLLLLSVVGMMQEIEVDAVVKKARRGTRLRHAHVVLLLLLLRLLWTAAP
jgi:hypothetical protein